MKKEPEKVMICEYNLTVIWNADKTDTILIHPHLNTHALLNVFWHSSCAFLQCMTQRVLERLAGNTVS